MDYRLNEEQTLLQDSLEGWLKRHYGFEDWRRLIASRPPYAESNWAQFAAMGWLGIAMAEDFGGLGFGVVEQMLVGEAFGAQLVLEPYVSSAVLGAGLIAEAGTPAQQAEFLPRIADGGLKLSFAFAEAASRFSLNHISAQAVRTADGYAISGRKILAFDAPGADRLLVLARTGGDVAGETGLSLFLVNPAEVGVAMHGYSTVDDRQAADIVFDKVIAEALIGAEGAALAPVLAATDRAIAYVCAEGVGAMKALCDASLNYVKIRKQFGQAIGDFQVIQHRLVDMRIHLETARAMTLYAAVAIGGDPIERARAVSAAKVQVGRAARFIGRNAIQLHGGIGMSNELPIGQYFKRLLVVETIFGDIAYHQKRFASLPSELA